MVDSRIAVAVTDAQLLCGWPWLPFAAGFNFEGSACWLFCCLLLAMMKMWMAAPNELASSVICLHSKANCASQN
jgi:hypothetical protein